MAKYKRGYHVSVTGRRYRPLAPKVKARLEAKEAARQKREWKKPHTYRESTIAYDPKAVKRANQRLRSIEKKGLQGDSPAYLNIQKYAIEYPKTKGKIYKTNAEGNPRFLSKTEFELLSEDDKAYYNQILKQFLENQTSTKKGIDERKKNMYDSFMDTYGDKFPDMTIDQYSEFFKIYRDMVEADHDNHFGYDELSWILEHANLDEIMTDNDMVKVFEYVADSRWSDIPKRYINKNYV